MTNSTVGTESVHSSLAKVFPNVPHTVLLHVLEQRGIPGHVLAMLHDIYSGSTTTHREGAFD